MTTPPAAHWLQPYPPARLRDQAPAGVGAMMLNPGRAGTPARSGGECLREALQGGTMAGGGVVRGGSPALARQRLGVPLCTVMPSRAEPGVAW